MNTSITNTPDGSSGKSREAKKPVELDPLELRGRGRHILAYLPISDDFEMPLRAVDPSTGQPLKGWCAFYFAWLALHHLMPRKWNLRVRAPGLAAERELIGLNTSPLESWFLRLLGMRRLRVGNLPKYLVDKGYTLSINGRACETYYQLRAALRTPNERGGHYWTADDAIDRVIDALRKGQVTGIDINLGPFGYRDHVLFVYAVTRESLVVVESLVVPGLGYTRIPLNHPHENALVMELPMDELRRRWQHRHGRIWTIAGRRQGA